MTRLPIQGTIMGSFGHGYPLVHSLASYPSGNVHPRYGVRVHVLSELLMSFPVRGVWSVRPHYCVFELNPV